MVNIRASRLGNMRSFSAVPEGHVVGVTSGAPFYQPNSRKETVMKLIVLCVALLLIAGCAWSEKDWEYFLNSSADAMNKTSHDLHHQQLQYETQQLRQNQR